MPFPPAIRLLAISTLALVPFARSQATLIDVSREGTASHTSEWNAGQFPAALAVDGDPNTFSHTDGSTANNGWTLVLDQEHEIRRVELVMRADCCGGRLSRTIVRVLDGEGDSVFDDLVQDPGPGETLTFDLPQGIIGQSVRVGFEDNDTNPGAGTTYVHLAEVRVFAEFDLTPIISLFEADPLELNAGQSSLLRWQVENADAVELVGTGPVADTGTLSVSPQASETFTLVATNDQGSRSENVSIIVDGVLLPPLLTEFMADNAGTVTRSDGSTPDWIEIWNPNPVALNLADYALTDDPEDPARYLFPDTLLEAGSYLIVDADSLTRDDVPATGFKLNQAADSYLALHDPTGRILQSFRYPRQRENVSFGPDNAGEPRFFLQPTPGDSKVTGTVEGFVVDTEFSVDRGFYDRPQLVTITSETPGARIYTTTDGSEPTPENPSAKLYQDPILVESTTVLRAAAYREGYLPTDVDTQTYIFGDQVAEQPDAPAGFPQRWVPSLQGVVSSVPAFSHFGMDDGVVASLPLRDRAGARFGMRQALLSIPTLSLVMPIEDLLDSNDGLHVNARNRGRAWERRASIEFIDPDSGEQVQANCGIRMHGGWNRYPEMLKKTFRLYFRSDYGDAKLVAPLFPDSNTDEFDRILLRSGNGKAWPSPWRSLSGAGNSLERNTYLRDQFMRDLQAEMGHDHVAGRFVHLYLNGHYWGLYNPVERPDEHMASSHFGGADEDYDVVKWIRGRGHVMAAGNDTAWNQLISLARRGPDRRGIYEAMETRLDIPNFIDYMLLNYFAANSDWVDSNAYALRDRAGRGLFKFYCWDSEETFLNPTGDSTNQHVPDTSTELHHAMRANLEYRILFGDRAQKHLFNGGALTRARTDATLMRRAWEVDRAIVGDSARWGNLLRPSDPYDREDWLAEIRNLRENYLGPRVTTLLAQLRADDLYPAVKAPTFTPHHGGPVDAGFLVSLKNSGGQEGTIFFTTDGSDPRAKGGAPSAHALALANEEQIEITSDTLVRARTLDGEDWSALDEARYLVGDRAVDLYVSELMYHPARPHPAAAEFVELTNGGSTPHDLRDLRLTGGIRFDFSAAGLQEIAPGERLVLGREQASFEETYPGVGLAGVYEGSLGNGGDTFSLEQHDGTVLWTLNYGDSAPWPGGTDGDGHSLVDRGGTLASPESWRPSVSPAGHPGTHDAVPRNGEDLLSYSLAGVSVEIASDGLPEFHLSSRLGADEVTISAEWSLDLKSWNREGFFRASLEPAGPGIAREVWVLSGPTAPTLFFRAVVSPQ